ncbi:peptide/nickel transport system substrate-binding protein [Lachnotalea glycerini]|nr:ABC transporter substrate-binding protein [Lachnotalea glycerini]PXV91106.1 peptide/nickel transport system substrate-binding protein [Lachnotalea glycerini]
MKKQIIAILLTACMGASVLGGCGSSKESSSDSGTTTEKTQTTTTDSATTDESTGEPKYGGVLKYATHITAATPGYTPEITNNAGLLYLTTAYESLLYYDESGNIIPKLATEWTTDADEPSITWTLREGVQFADGTAFNAEAVKRNIEEYQSCERNETKNIKECQVIDDTHIKMILNNWSSSTLESVGFFVYYMSPTALEDVEALRNASCGTGPFQVTEFQTGVATKYAKNENYWQEGKPYLDGVEIYVVSEPTTRSSAFEAGEYDMIHMNNLTVANDLINSGKYVVNENTSGQGLVTTGLIPNSADSTSPFADYRVRQAMCYAIDSDAIAKAFGYGLIKTTNQWAAPGAVTYDDTLKSFDYNPEKAKELLTEAGYPDGFTTTLTTDSGSKDMFTAAANMLEEVGIHCEIELVDESTGSNLYMTGTWKGIMGHYASIAPDLGLYMGRHLDVDGAFYAKGIQHPQEAQDLLEKIRVAATDEEKIDLEHQMQQLMYNSETGLALFGKPLFIQNEPNIKQYYVKDDNCGVCHASTWNIENCWLDK